MSLCWQAPKQSLQRPSQASSRLNVLAWLSEAGELVSYTRDESIDSGFVIECIRQWASGLSRETVLILDKAPIHRSKAFKACLAPWQEQGLYVFFCLPTLTSISLHHSKDDQNVL